MATQWRVMHEARLCSARLRRQLRRTGPRRLRLYARNCTCGALRRRCACQGGAVTKSVLCLRRSGRLHCCSTTRKGLCWAAPARAARGPAGAAVHHRGSLLVYVTLDRQLGLYLCLFFWASTRFVSIGVITLITLPSAARSDSIYASKQKHDKIGPFTQNPHVVS